MLQLQEYLNGADRGKRTVVGQKESRLIIEAPGSKMHRVARRSTEEKPTHYVQESLSLFSLVWLPRAAALRPNVKGTF